MTDLLGAGYYFSTQAPGLLAGAWRLVETIKVTNATCNNKNIVNSVQARDAAGLSMRGIGGVGDALYDLTRTCATAGCFKSCPDVDDIKSDCVIECFYRTVSWTLQMLSVFKMST